MIQVDLFLFLPLQVWWLFLCTEESWSRSWRWSGCCSPRESRGQSRRRKWLLAFWWRFLYSLKKTLNWNRFTKNYKLLKSQKKRLKGKMLLSREGSNPFHFLFGQLLIDNDEVNFDILVWLEIKLGFNYLCLIFFP
jgi:hypothetical protein